MSSIGGFSAALHGLLLAGAVVFLLVILLLLKRGRLNVQYSIIWLGAAAIFLVFALFPMLVLHLNNILGTVVPANLVFILLFVFVLLLLLSLSTIVTGFAGKIKRLTQTQALLEKRVRQLEAQLADATGKASLEDNKKPGTQGKEGSAVQAPGTSPTANNKRE